MLIIFRKSADDYNGMFSEGIGAVFIQVLTSWQVIFISIALVLLIFMVNHVARTYRRPRSVSKSKPKKAKVQKQKKEQPSAGEDNSNEALGLEESV